MWNFIGWDNTTTYAEEVNKPIRSYLISLCIAFAVVFGIYFIAITIAINAGIGSCNFQLMEGFPSLGTLIGGYGLGAMIAVGGMASALGLCSAVLLSVSRIPQVMSDDRVAARKAACITPYI